MLLQASIEIANAERWALEIGDLPTPAGLQPNLRRSAYEVTVVDVLHRVARRYFDRLGYRAVWERPFRTGSRGRPESVDIALFDSASQREVRLELGLYSAAKLRDDSQKLARLSTTPLDGFGTIENILLLWEVTEEKLVQATARDAMRKFKVDAASALAAGATHRVAPLLASSVDLFVAESGAGRRATAGLFELVPQAP